MDVNGCTNGLLNGWIVGGQCCCMQAGATKINVANVWFISSHFLTKYKLYVFTVWNVSTQFGTTDTHGFKRIVFVELAKEF